MGSKVIDALLNDERGIKMRTLLIIAGILLVLAVNFVLYCCIRVGAKEDRLLENHRKEQIDAGRSE